MRCANWSDVQFPRAAGRPDHAADAGVGRRAAKAGTQRARVTYQTGGITWWADYNLIFSEGADANRGFVDVGAWVSILNQSGASYQDAKLKLIAGDVHRAQPGTAEMRHGCGAWRATASNGRGAAGFEEKSFFEYHLYTLGRPATLPEQLDQADRALRPGDARAGEEAARLLRRATATAVLRRT